MQTDRRKNFMLKKKIVNFTKEEEKYFRQLSEYKFAVDLQSKMVDARRDGSTDRAFAMARNMIADGEPVDKIMRYTELTREEIESLK